MQKLTQAILGATLACAAAPALAAGTSPHTVTGNLNFVSDYAFRGISQTDATPAIQGGFDYSHSSGFYIGTWASNVDANFLGGANIEIDVYGGYNGKITDDLSYNVGLLQYYYPSGSFPNLSGTGSKKLNNLEAYAGVTWKWFNIKYSYALTDYFGTSAATTTLATGDTDGTGYLEANFNYELPYAVNFSAHYGDTMVKNSNALDYQDWKIGLSKEVVGFNVGVAYVDTKTKTVGGAPVYPNHLADSRVILSVGKTF